MSFHRRRRPGIAASSAHFFSVWNLAILLVAPDHRLLGAQGRHLPDRIHVPIDGQQPFDQRHDRARGDDPARLEQLRPVGGLDPRHLASARQRPANPAGPAVEAGDASSASSSARSIGLINGLLVTRAKINSFIATLGSGTLLLGMNQWYTGGRQVVGVLPDGLHGHFGQDPVHRHSGCGDLRAGHRAGALGGVRLPSARPLPLCHRRQPARGDAERHLDPLLRDARLRRLGHARPLSPASCSRRSSRSARARSVRS